MGRYICQGIYRDGSGNVVADGTVSVYLAGTTTAASVYGAVSGGTAVNSVTTESDGSFAFYADTDDYATSQQFKIVLSKTDYESGTYDYILIFAPSTCVSGPTSSTDHNIPMFDGATGTVLEDSGLAYDELVTLTDTQTLTNKTLTTPAITAGSYVYSVSPGALSANRTLSLPSITGTDTVAVLGLAQTMANKTLTSPVLNTGVSGTAVDTDGTMANNSDTLLASQKATKTYAMPLSYLDTDGTCANNSDTKVASQKAMVTYIASQIASEVGWTTTAKTANATLTTAQCNGLNTFTNYGASGAIELSMPAGATNLRCSFMVSAAQYLRVNANGTEVISYDNVDGAAGGYVRSNEIGRHWSMLWDGAKWRLENINGDLLYDA